MKKIGLLLGTVCATWLNFAVAQEMFWNFDDSQNPLPIPSECDAKFDEIRGGVFMPTMDEMYEYGMSFLKNSSVTVQQRGAYCLLAAALQGHPDAQYQLAQLYEDGVVVPQDDISAYKWAFIAALNGSKEAERLTLTLEQFLTTPELEQTSSAIYETNMQITENLKQRMEEERLQIEENKRKLAEMHDEIRKQFGPKGAKLTSEIVKAEEKPTSEASEEKDSVSADSTETQETPNNFKSLFSESDRMK